LGLLPISFSPGFQNNYLATGIASIRRESRPTVVRYLLFHSQNFISVLILLASLAVVIFAVMLTIFVTTFGTEKKNKQQPFLDLLILRDLIFWQASRPKRAAGQSLSATVERIKGRQLLNQLLLFSLW
jgi:hypothetical protein